MFPPDDYFDHIDDDDDRAREADSDSYSYTYTRRYPVAKCKHCGSTAVRWRQQGGKWVLFSDVPGVPHACPRPTVVTDFD